MDKRARATLDRIGATIARTEVSPYVWQLGAWASAVIPSASDDVPAERKESHRVNHAGLFGANLALEAGD